MLTASQRPPAAVPLDVTFPIRPSEVDVERRESARETRAMRVTVSALGWTRSQSCATHDLSEGGLYVRLPAECNLSVGQRCEVGFVGGGAPSCVDGEIRYATVVRTDALSPPLNELIGAGLRFDQPLFL